MKQKYPNNESSGKYMFLLIGGITVILLAVIGLFAVRESSQVVGAENIKSFSKTDTSKPAVKVNRDTADLGRMKVSDEKKTDFVIENSGTRPLQLYQVRTSCDCTYGKFTIDGKESPEFTMHSKNPWVGELAPGKKATLIAIYRPFIMPVKGPVSRDIYVRTNDPENLMLTFTVKANVE